MTYYSCKEIYKFIQSDCFRYTGKNSLFIIIKLYFRNKTFRWQCAFRLRHGNKIVNSIGTVLWLFNQQKKYIQIPKEVQIGYGLYIGHNGPVVLSPYCIIGNNCNLSQFVTIGSNHNQSAHIGDNVYIGPMVCIVEDVTIGDNVTIGAGSVVTKSIPSNATAAGNYAKVLNYNSPGRYIGNRWPL